MKELVFPFSRGGDTSAIPAFRPAPGCPPESILVAIPTLNEAQHIERTLASLMEGAEGLDRVRFVVADGGSSDGTVEIVRRLQQSRPNLQLIHNPDRIQAAAVNRVARDCAGPAHRVLVRCDAHAAYPAGYVRRVADSLAERHVAALSTVMDSRGITCFQKGVAWASDCRIGSGGSGHRGGQRSGYVDHGHHAGFRLDWWRRIGGYDTGFRVNEDAELDHRLRRAGGHIWLDAEIRIGYRPRPTPMALIRQYWGYGQGRAQTILHHRMRPRLRQMIPVAVTLLLAIGLALAVLDPRFLLLHAGYGAVLAGTALWLALTKRSACGLCAALALGAMHLSWGSGFIWHCVTRAQFHGRLAQS